MKPLRKVHRKLTRPDGTKVWVWVPLYGPPSVSEAMPDLRKVLHRSNKQSLGRASAGPRKW